MNVRIVSLLWLICLVCQELDLCSSINDEGTALSKFKERIEVDPYNALWNWNGEEVDHCKWFGVECSGDGTVIVLNLKDLCLKGTLAPEIANLIHMKFLILNNNSLYGSVPREIGNLQKLEILDLRQNNFEESFSSDRGSLPSLRMLLLGSKQLVDHIQPELFELNFSSDIQADKDHLAAENGAKERNSGNAVSRRLLRHRWHHHKHAPASAPAPSPILSPSPSSSHFARHSGSSSPSAPSHAKDNNGSSTSEPPSRSSSLVLPPAPLATKQHQDNRTHLASPLATSTSASSPSSTTESVKSKVHWQIYVLVGGAFFLLILSAILFILCRANKVVSVKPWSTGLSGQLRKAFVTGVPVLKRSELQVACEDFSNVIGSLSECMLYKGTLSSGVEIAVVSTVVMSSKDWSQDYETQFRKKISVLSKVNHKNFINLLGYCEEEEPFTRIMVFEYAPNGTLFEHLHIREVEHLDWATRLRVAMGIAYCLEHMQQLDPPVIFDKLDSSSIYLTEDFAAKISNLEFWNGGKEVESPSRDSSKPVSQLSGKELIVYKFGLLLLEILSGKRPFSEDSGLLVLWSSGYFQGQRPLREMADPTLEAIPEEQLRDLSDVIWSCISPHNFNKRPTMTEIVSRLREITGITPEGAAPKISPLWWAELEIVSTEAN